MAENEIVKHVEAAYKAVKNPETHWLHKLREVGIEIFIIVFAVSLSIWFHNWSDNLHEHKEEKEFLTGLEKDVRADLEAAQAESAFYSRQLYRLRYFQRIAAGEAPNSDSMAAYQRVLFSATDLVPHISRYEGLKGSGKFGIIENTELLNNIINLHEVTITYVEKLNGSYTDYINRVGTFIQEHGQMTPDNTGIANARDLLQMPGMRVLLFFGTKLISSNVLRGKRHLYRPMSATHRRDRPGTKIIAILSDVHIFFLLCQSTQYTRHLNNYFR